MIPDYVICLECESPVYTFEWKDEKVSEAICTVCGNDEKSQFVTETEYEEMSMDSRYWPGS
jgi:translation initiation factor 2 beta subunit (eIF-2beta)/eIF-5